ncbi:MAG: DUF3307 domain-containing protein, partial [Verrucomicrobia bacterium]|nr:DUF3307 domain-containing protein [Verrucomicrobiota bacterium]
MAWVDSVEPIQPFLILLIAHLIGDFVLQTEQMALKKGHVLAWLILHASELGLITWLLCWSVKSWIVPVVVVVFVTHVIFDWAKAQLKGNPLRWYIVDQSGHVLTLWICALWIVENADISSMPLTQWLPEKVQAMIAAYILAARPLTIGMGLFLRPWQEEILKANGNGSKDCPVTGLTRSGEWIGNLERFLVLTCIFAGQYVLVGATLIAKAVMRHSETSRPDQRK